MKGQNVPQIEIVAKRLGDLHDQVVFVGGAVVDLYATHIAPLVPRVTNDIDCFIEIESRGKYYILQEKLRSFGFKEDTRPEAPICRWTIDGITVDIMPSDPDILGFSNPWYQKGITNTVIITLPNEMSIYILDAVHFVASKFIALSQREGGIDWRYSTDFEDIIYITGHREELVYEISMAYDELREFLVKSYKMLLEDPDFLAEAINVNYINSLSPEQQMDIRNRIQGIAQIP